MGGKQIKKAIIRLAHQHPDLRGDLLSLLQGSTRRAEYVGEGQEFYDLLEKKWHGVKWDGRRGTADLGSLEIGWEESGNDSAVIVEITNIRHLKGDPETVMRVLDMMRKALNNL